MLTCRGKRPAAPNDRACSGSAAGRGAGRDASLQSILIKECVLNKRFRSDGPILGAEFDPLPDGAFGVYRSGSDYIHVGRKEKQGTYKERKVLLSQIESCIGSEARTRNDCSVKKFGIGKGLMTVWKANIDSAVLLSGSGRRNSCSDKNFQRSKQKPSKTKNQLLAMKQRKLAKQVPGRKKQTARKTKGVFCMYEKPINEPRKNCKLSLEAFEFSDQEINGAMKELLDDEELELREKQAGPNPLSCTHLTTNEKQCSLCKDLLAKFPPHTVKMKLPLNARPWNTSPSMVKKLFKIFRFLCTHSVLYDISPFTLDEFAFAFHEKESFLLGKIHVTLLSRLFSYVEKDLGSTSVPRASKDSKYSAFLHFVRHQEFDVKFWSKSLNSLTWIEILRQVLIAAGSGSSQNLLRRQSLFKDDPVTSYGLRHGTLKGELVTILYGQGSKGMKISELAVDPQVVGLNLLEVHGELEDLIHSTLSSDVTLFEKISTCAYRLRLNPQNFKAIEIADWDTEESGSVDDVLAECSSSSDIDDSALKSGLSDLMLIRHKQRQHGKSNSMCENVEIDESNSGDSWILGLMDGEYSDLSINEKLNVLVALVELTASGPSTRMEDSTAIVTTTRPNVYQRSFGAKIKKSTSNRQVVDSTSGEFTWRLQNARQVQQAKASNADKSLIKHPMQSVYLGSDRRYNSYWLFLGPCDENDPGHRRVYFESSEDGHWEVIDTMEELCSLISTLDCRGTRESYLYSRLQVREASLCQAMASQAAAQDAVLSSGTYKSDAVFNCGDGNSPISDVDNGLMVTDDGAHDPTAQTTAIVDFRKFMEENKRKINQHQAFDTWIWKHFYSSLSSVKYGRRSYLESLARCEVCNDLFWRDEKHCKVCHFTFELDFDMEERYAVHSATCKENYDGDRSLMHKILPSKLQSLKAAMHVVEANMPDDAFVNSWRKSGHKLWVSRLKRSSSLHELLQVLSDFVNAISEGWLAKSSVSMGPNTVFDEIVGFFPTIPQTSSSVALWLAKLDAVIAPKLNWAQSSRIKKNAKSKT